MLYCRLIKNGNSLFPVCAVNGALIQLKHSAIILPARTRTIYAMKTILQGMRMKIKEPVIADHQTAIMPVSIFRAGRLALHLLYGMALAIVYPQLDLALNESGCLLVANHISWLDIFVLNAIHPSQFIAKSEVRDWPLIGWLSRRCGTIFIERALRQNASAINRRVSLLLKQGACIGLFPEGTTTDGKQVGHFHSALLQPAIDAGTKICPIALRYQNKDGFPSPAAAFTGNTTLIESIWKILRAPHLNASVVFTPALMASSENRRTLARAAQSAVAHELQYAGTARQAAIKEDYTAFPKTLLSSQSAYALLVDPLLNQLPK
jgi:1-acyl-sn-glycerol-3-phosphate acyltransferase